MSRYTDWGEGAVKMADVKSTGMTGICRYMSRNQKKNLTVKQRNDALALGLDIVLVFEDSATRATEGTDAGRADAFFSVLFAQQIGAPPGMTLRTTVDTDTTWDRVRPYIVAWNETAAAHGYNGDLYAGFPVLAGAYDAGQSARGWQTVAWSKGQVHHSAVLLQDQFHVNISGVDCDSSLVLGDVNGWRAQTHPTPTPKDDDMEKVLYVAGDSSRGKRLYLGGGKVGAVMSGAAEHAYLAIGVPERPVDAAAYDTLVAQSS